MNESNEKMNQYLDDLLTGDSFEMSILANASALIKQMTEDINWVGYYVLKQNKLYLGPFQGKVACNVIEVGKGVCGNSAKTGKTIVVPDVNKFPGHIACDARSLSEIVVPVRDKSGAIVAVLDVDSDKTDQFDEVDARQLEMIADLLARNEDRI